MRLIDADQMLRDESEAYMKAQVKVSGLTYAVNVCVHEKLLQLIADTPTADPVRHGKWIPIGERKLFRLYGEFDVPQSETKMEYSCSTDGCWVQTTYRYPFCPMCGAKMDGGDEDAHRSD